MFTFLFLNSFHYVLNLLAALAYFSGGLFYLDRWRKEGKKIPLVLRGIGFFLLSFESALFASSYPTNLLTFGTQIFTIVGLLCILVSLIIESSLLHKKTKQVAIALLLPTVSFALLPVSSFFYFLVGIAYTRDTAEPRRGLITSAFFILALHELLSTSQFWASTSVTFWSQLLADYGPMWIAFHILELTGIIMLGIWGWLQVRSRLHVQLFLATLTITLTFFLTTTLLFSYFLFDNIEQHLFSDLEKNALSVKYLLQTLTDKTITQADAIAQSASIQQYVMTNNKPALLAKTTDFLLSQKNSTLVIASTSGTVLMRAEEFDRTNDTVQGNTIFQKAASGMETTDIIYHDALPTPQLIVEASVPLFDLSSQTKKQIGVVMTGFPIDTAFVDGIKKETGLDITIFGSNKRVATTFVTEDGKHRETGTLETTPVVVQTVLKQGKNYKGEETVLNKPYFVAYVPIRSIDNKIVGMIFVGENQSTFIAIVQKAIDITFLGSIILLMFSIIPAYYFTKYITYFAKKEHKEK